MARIRDKEKYQAQKEQLLEIGLSLIQCSSYKAVGINDVLTESGIPKGSFYHYFTNKEAFGIEVAEYYHIKQMASARTTLNDSSLTPKERLCEFFANARKEFKQRAFSDGCLMCNLSTELGPSNPRFQKVLNRQWDELTEELALCIKELGTQALGLPHLNSEEAADWLLNSWSGALARMKITGSEKPLTLFEKTLFTV